MIAAVPNTKVSLGTLCESRPPVSPLNRVNTTNIRHVVSELFSEDLIRGRGLSARRIIKAPLYTSLCGPRFDYQHITGELLLHRLISQQFRRAFKRNNNVRRRTVVPYLVNSYLHFQTGCHSTRTFTAHLINQGVAHELIALQNLRPPP